MLWILWVLGWLLFYRSDSGEKNTHYILIFKGNMYNYCVELKHTQLCAWPPHTQGNILLSLYEVTHPNNKTSWISFQNMMWIQWLFFAEGLWILLSVRVASRYLQPVTLRIPSLNPVSSVIMWPRHHAVAQAVLPRLQRHMGTNFTPHAALLRTDGWTTTVQDNGWHFSKYFL